jgi:hypothetical protein
MMVVEVVITIGVLVIIHSSYFYPQAGPGAYSNGYSAGVADAIYDHEWVVRCFEPGMLYYAFLIFHNTSIISSSS